MTEAAPQTHSRLLGLPTELRLHIFTLALQDVHCRQPLLIWDAVYTRTTGLRSREEPPSVLRVCKRVHRECIPILYSTATIEISIRSEQKDTGPPCFLKRVSPLKPNAWLSKFRHIELEVTYSSHDPEAVNRACRRIHNLGLALRALKTINLTFFDESTTTQHMDESWIRLADSILRACENDLKCERFIGVHRNMTAKDSMSSGAWKEFKQRKGVQVGDEEAGEEFREVDFDYYERAFRSKN